MPVSDAHTGRTTYVGSTRMNQLAICVPVIDQRALTTNRAKDRPAPSASSGMRVCPSSTPSRPMDATFVESEGAAATISTPAAADAGSATVVPKA